MGLAGDNYSKDNENKAKSLMEAMLRDPELLRETREWKESGDGTEDQKKCLDIFERTFSTCKYVVFNPSRRNPIHSDIVHTEPIQLNIWRNDTTHTHTLSDIMESAAALAMRETIMKLEGELEEARAHMALTYEEDGKMEEGSSVKLRNTMRSHKVTAAHTTTTSLIFFKFVN